MRLLTGAEGEGADGVRPGARAGAAQEVWLLLSPVTWVRRLTDDLSRAKFARGDDS